MLKFVKILDLSPVAPGKYTDFYEYYASMYDPCMTLQLFSNFRRWSKGTIPHIAYPEFLPQVFTANRYRQSHSLPSAPILFTHLDDCSDSVRSHSSNFRGRRREHAFLSTQPGFEPGTPPNSDVAIPVQLLVPMLLSRKRACFGPTLAWLLTKTRARHSLRSCSTSLLASLLLARA